MNVIVTAEDTPNDVLRKLHEAERKGLDALYASCQSVHGRIPLRIEMTPEAYCAFIPKLAGSLEQDFVVRARKFLGIPIYIRYPQRVYPCDP